MIKEMPAGISFFASMGVAEQLVQGDGKHIGDGQEQQEVGIRTTLLPLRDRLHRHGKAVCHLSLGHAPLDAELSDIGSDLKFHLQTSCEKMGFAAHRVSA
jgi:hypothetical protein